MKLKKYIPQTIIYRMEDGETKKTVAEKFNTTDEDIALLSVEKHYDGEFVEIKKCNQFSHVVKPLENLASIALKYQVSEQHIIKSNNLLSTRLFIGQKLRF